MARKSLLGLAGFVSVVGDEPVWIGVDVHKEKYYAAAVTASGLKQTWSCPADAEGFVNQLKGLGVKIAQVAHEAGPTGFVLARTLESAGLPALVAAPSKIPRPAGHQAKNDRLDSIRLAEMALWGSLGRTAVAVPTRLQEARRSLLRRRQQLTDSIRRVKPRIRSLLLEFGIKEPDGLKYWSRAGLAALAELELSEPIQLTLKSLVRELDYLDAEMGRVDKDLKAVLRETKEQEHINHLVSVPGVGPVTAQTFCLELFRPERFNRAEELTSYLGLAPMIRHSGSGKPIACLRPVGQKRLRSLLIEAAWVWKRVDEYAAGVYTRLLSRHGVAQKAIVAVARKLAIILWGLCLESRTYRPAIAG